MALDSSLKGSKAKIKLISFVLNINKTWCAQLWKVSVVDRGVNSVLRDGAYLHTSGDKSFGQQSESEVKISFESVISEKDLEKPEISMNTRFKLLHVNLLHERNSRNLWICCLDIERRNSSELLINFLQLIHFDPLSMRHMMLAMAPLTVILREMACIVHISSFNFYKVNQ